MNVSGLRQVVAVWLLAYASFAPRLARADGTGGPSLAGTYQDDRLVATLEDEPGAPGSYRGSPKLGGTTYPLTARAGTASHLDGTFTDANGSRFPFTADLQGTTLTLTSGATTYRLTSTGGGGGGVPIPPVPPARRREYQVTPNANALALMPELRDAPPPAWVKPGLRIVTYQADATIAGSRLVMVQDPDGHWVNKATGQNVSFQENAGAGGHGFGVVDVIAVLPDAVVAEVRSFSLTPPDNVPTFIGGFGSVTTPSCALDLWVHPQVMAKYLDLNAQGISTSRVPYKAAGRTYDAMWRQVVSDAGASTLVFDVESGLKLHTALSSSVAPSSVVVDGRTQAVGGSTNISQTTLAGIREIRSPWTRGRLPRALDGVRELTYDGAQTVTIPGAPAMSNPLRSVVTLTGRGDDFVQGVRTGVMMIGNARNDLGKADMVSGPAQLTPIAVEPDDLARLRQGQVLDRDPNSQGVVTVSFVGRDRRGADVVVISEQFPAARGAEPQRIDTTYDRATGLMVAVAFNNPALHQVNRVTLTAKR